MPKKLLSSFLHPPPSVLTETMKTLSETIPRGFHLKNPAHTFDVTLLTNDKKLDAVILPLLSPISSAPPTISLNEACKKLKKICLYWAKHTIKNQRKRSLSSNNIETYFRLISENNLYREAYEETLSPMLIEIAEKLPNDTKDLSSLGSEILPPFLLAIEERTCLDQHRAALKEIVTQQITKNIDPPLHKILLMILDKMETQIKLTLRDWDRTVFKGYIETEPIHSKHIAILILDDLFKTAGGSLILEEDLLLARTNLGKDIYRECFRGKLTLSHLLSEGHENWRSYFAKQLSLGPNDLPSDTKLPLHDVVNSPNFLNFIETCGKLNTREKNELMSLKNPELDQDLEFENSWVKFSDSIGLEETTYKETFSTLLLAYIYETMKIEIKPSPQPKYPITSLPVDDDVKEKLIKHYFLNSDPPTFSSSEIDRAMMHKTKSSEYQRPFIKPYLRLSDLMIAHCEPQEVEKIFDQYIWPNKKQDWVFDCLLIMLVTRPECAIKIPFHQLALIQKHKKVSLFHTFSRFYPTEFVQFLQKNSELITHIQFIHDKDGDTPFHWLALNHPTQLYQLLIDKTTSPYGIARIPDREDHTVLHDLASVDGEAVEKLIRSKHIALLDLYKKNNYGLTAFHRLCTNQSETMIRLIRDKTLQLKDFETHKNRRYLTSLHYLARIKPRIIEKIILEELLPFSGILHMSLDWNPIHELAKDHPSVFLSLFTKSKTALKTLIDESPSFRENPLFLFSINHTQHFLNLTTYTSNNLAQIARLRGPNDQTLYHYISRRESKRFIIFLERHPNMVHLLKGVKDDRGDSPLDALRSHNPDLLEHLIQSRPNLSSIIMHINEVTTQNKLCSSSRKRSSDCSLAQEYQNKYFKKI